ncbi:MAG: hypothetical protein DDT26_00877 [Dehalococcoidia bacterium]|nr:hypothetical protein [Chloroflexota bacterium]
MLRQSLPELLGDEGHEGMQQPQYCIQSINQYGDRRGTTRGTQPNLGQLDVPIAELAPDKIVDLAQSLTEHEALEGLIDLGYQPVQATPDPAVFDEQFKVQRSRF